MPGTHDRLLSKFRGTLFGLAFGDALGAETEFVRSVEAIRDMWPPDGPEDLYGDPARVTDDTQMAMAVARALLDCAPSFGEVDKLESAFRRRFVEWHESPDNDRAPGLTCGAACRDLGRGIDWLDASRTDSCGCGANMRVAPVALLPVTHEHRAAIAQFQAALTHGHERALAASDLTSHTIAVLLSRDSISPTAFLHDLRTYAEAQRAVYQEHWLRDLWAHRSPRPQSPRQFIAAGWDSCLRLLRIVEEQLRHPTFGDDPCNATGEGWVADEAFATALLCFLLSPDEPRAVIHRGAVTSGDSDSIACMAGAMAGALHGIEAWPAAWVDRVEYADTLQELACGLGGLV